MARKKDKFSPGLPVVDVGCAVIEKRGHLLIAQRKPGDHLGGYWEFPGGKLRREESMERCLTREVYEELGVLIRPRFLIRMVFSEKMTRALVLHFYACRWVQGKPVRRDCLDFCWVSPRELRRFLFPPSDALIIRDLIEREHTYFCALRFDEFVRRLP